MPCSTYFTTPVTFVKPNGVTFLGLYEEEKLARKMVKAGHIIRIPEPSLTIDAAAYDQYLANKDDWSIGFDISDGRRLWIKVPEFNHHKRPLDRGRGPQWRIAMRYLHRDGDTGLFTPSSITSNPVSRTKLKEPQLSLWGE